MTSPPLATDVSVPGNPSGIARALGASAALRVRRLELLPLEGAGAPFTEPQGREPGSSTSPAELAELVSSIARVGLLQPVLVEEMPSGGRRLVAGERRLRALRWGAAHLPDNPHFQAVPALVCPGPLSEEDRRIWQLVENLARADLRPGELAAALLYERSALLVAKLEAAGIDVPSDAATIEDPVARFRALDGIRLKAGLHHLGAPWEEVLARLGIQMGPDVARQLVRAFSTLPRDLSSEMDDAGIALATRLEFLRLDRGSRAAGRALWDLVRQRGRPELLTAAVREQLADPRLDSPAALEHAETIHDKANEARAVANRRPVARPEPASPETLNASVAPVPARIIPVGQPGDCEPIAPTVLVDGALAALRDLLRALRAGARLGPYDAGSLVLHAQELLDLVDAREVSTR